MQLTSYKYIFQLPKHTKSLPPPQHFPSLDTYVLYIHFSLPLHTHTHIFTYFIFIYVLFLSLLKPMSIVFVMEIFLIITTYL